MRSHPTLWWCFSRFCKDGSAVFFCKHGLRCSCCCVWVESSFPMFRLSVYARLRLRPWWWLCGNQFVLMYEQQCKLVYRDGVFVIYVWLRFCKDVLRLSCCGVWIASLFLMFRLSVYARLRLRPCWWCVWPYSQFIIFLFVTASSGISIFQLV